MKHSMLALLVLGSAIGAVTQPAWSATAAHGAGSGSVPASASASASFKVGEFPNAGSQEATIYRGAIVFKNYCVLCHGIKADGAGRAAKLYNPKPANLLLSDKNDQYKELIIRGGGAALGRSEFMPPWGKELTDEQIGDVVAYLRSIAQTRAEAK